MATLLVMCVLAFHVSLLPHLMHLHVYLHTCIDIAVFRALHHRAGFLALLWARFTLVSIGRVHLCFLNRHQKPSASRIELIPNPDNACSPDWSPFKSFPTACSPNSCNIWQVAVVQRIQRIPVFSHLKQVPPSFRTRSWGQMVKWYRNVLHICCLQKYLGILLDCLAKGWRRTCIGNPPWAQTLDTTHSRHYNFLYLIYKEQQYQQLIRIHRGVLKGPILTHFWLLQALLTWAAEQQSSKTTVYIYRVNENMIPNCAMHMIRLGRGTTTVTLSEHASKPWSWVVKACRINCNGAYLRNKTSMKSALKGQPGIRLMLTWHHGVSDLFFDVFWISELRKGIATILGLAPSSSVKVPRLWELDSKPRTIDLQEFGIKTIQDISRPYSEDIGEWWRMEIQIPGFILTHCTALP